MIHVPWPSLRAYLEHIDRHKMVVFVCCLWATSCAGVARADNVVAIVPATTQTTFFSDDDVKLQLDLNVEQAIEGKVAWKLTALHRTVARGDANVKVAPGKPSSMTLKMRMPHIKAGVIQHTILSAVLIEAGMDSPSAKFQRDLWVFASDPFVDRTRWLEQLDIQLFDPTGETANLFEDAKIPFQNIRSIASLETIESGIVIVAEGVKRDVIAETLFSLASSGCRVLWLAPERVEFEFPGSEHFPGKRPNEVLLGRSDKVAQLDKRLDQHAWSDTQNSASLGLKIVAKRNRTVVEIGSHDEGWAWLQAEYINPRGQLILCGLGLIDNWNASPTPRYMLARLLEQLDDTESSTE